MPVQRATRTEPNKVAIRGTLRRLGIFCSPFVAENISNPTGAPPVRWQRNNNERRRRNPSTTRQTLLGTAPFARLLQVRNWLFFSRTYERRQRFLLAPNATRGCSYTQTSEFVGKRALARKANWNFSSIACVLPPFEGTTFFKFEGRLSVFCRYPCISAGYHLLPSTHSKATPRSSCQRLENRRYWIGSPRFPRMSFSKAPKMIFCI